MEIHKKVLAWIWIIWWHCMTKGGDTLCHVTHRTLHSLGGVSPSPAVLVHTAPCIHSGGVSPSPAVLVHLLLAESKRIVRHVTACVLFFAFVVALMWPSWLTGRKEPVLCLSLLLFARAGSDKWMIHSTGSWYLTSLCSRNSHWLSSPSPPTYQIIWQLLQAVLWELLQSLLLFDSYELLFDNFKLLFNNCKQLFHLSTVNCYWTTTSYDVTTTTRCYLITISCYLITISCNLTTIHLYLTTISCYLTTISCLPTVHFYLTSL